MTKNSFHASNGSEKEAVVQPASALRDGVTKYEKGLLTSLLNEREWFLEC